MGDKSKEKLKDMMAQEVTTMFEAILDYVQVACPTKDTYGVLRSKILRVGNNCIRTLKKKADNFDVKYTNIAEDVIEVKPPTKK
jgi:hypothetical protein